MEQTKFLLFLLAVLFVLPLGARAESGFLGDSGAPLSTDKLPPSLTFSVNSTNYAFSRSDILNLIKEESRLVVDRNYSSEIENPEICVYQKSISCRLTDPYADYAKTKKSYIRTIDSGKLDGFLSDLAEKSDTAPVNAKLQMTDGKASVFALSTPGIQLDKDKSATMLSAYITQGDFKNPLSLPFKTIQPEVSTDSIENLGITTLISEGVSNFAGSPKNRIHNLTVGAEKFDGALIKPGEEFSFLKTLGPVDAESGYLPELSIVGNATIPEYGGGMCQVSTTAFRAAVNAGLEITARSNHAYPVGYYSPQGTDATVYIPSPDLRFINNTPGYILIQTKIVGTKLTFDFYGTSDGRTVKTEGPIVLEHNPDGSMKTTYTEEVFDKDGSQILKKVFKSNYASPSKYPHPGQEPVYAEKPKDWSVKQWEDYKAAHGM